MELGLSLGYQTRKEEEGERRSGEPPVQLSLLPLPTPATPLAGFPWATGNGNLDPSAGSGLDVNRVPSTTEEEGEAERASDDEENAITARKKLRLSKEQSASLEESFKEHNTLNPKQKLALAEQLNLRPRQAEVWFQNRRARTKLKQTETDCGHLKRRCEALTEENCRLQKELSELRALKSMSHPFFMQLPATTLSMCPSCERTTTTTAIVATTKSSTSKERSADGCSAKSSNSFATMFGKPKFSSFGSDPATSRTS